VEAPPLQQIRRVSAKSIAIVAVVALIAYTLISAFSGVDFASMADALSTADWAWVVLAVLLSPVIQMFFAFSTIGSTLKRLRYVPVLMLQYAIQFIALCLPSTAARLALEVRFFERFGLPAATAIGIGMIDSFSGFLVQISLILLILVSGLPGFTSAVRGTTDTTASDGSSPGPLLVVAVFTLIAVLVTFAVPRLRHRLLGSVPRIKARIAEQRKNAGDALLVIRHPRKVATMLLGNLGAQVMQALVLGVDVPAGSGLVGIFVSELGLPEGAVVALVVRSGSAIAPDRQTRLRADDQMLVVTTEQARTATQERLRLVARHGRLARWRASDV